MLYHTLTGHREQLLEQWLRSTDEERVVTLLRYIDHLTNGQPTPNQSHKLAKAHKTLALALGTPYHNERQTAFTMALNLLKSTAAVTQQIAAIVELRSTQTQTQKGA